MPEYAVFGGRLRSDVPFPHPVAPEGTSADWLLRTVRQPEVETDAEFLGMDNVQPGIDVEMFRSRNGYHLRYDDTGSFHVSSDGSTILWNPPRDASMANAWIDVTSRVLATSLHAAGRLVLHGSAVSVDGRAIGFIAPKGAGKSTLALALTRSGGRLLTDDTLPVETGEPAWAGPGLHAVRLRPDSADWLALRPDDLADAADGKSTYNGLDETSVQIEAVPLSSIYILMPVDPGPDTPAVERTRLSDVEATLGLVVFSKLGPLLGGSERAVVMSRAAELVRTVPVYSLRVARDQDRIEEAVQCLRQWHRPS